jgi:hypothetical protein
MANSDRYLPLGVLGGDSNRPIKYGLDNLNNSIRVAIPCIVKTFNPSEGTVECQPAIKEPTLGDKGVTGFESLPLLVDVPVVYPHGGGTTITWPLEPGDEVLVVFSDMCIDAWWQSGGIGVQPDIRRHDLSDGMAFPGPFSQPKISGSPIKTDSLNINTNKKIYITGGGEISIKSTSPVRIDGSSDVYINGIAISAWKADYDQFKAKYNSHTHSGVQSGGSNTGGPSSPA